MKNIGLIEKFDLNGNIQSKEDISAHVIFNGFRRRMVEVKLVNNGVLKKHKAAEPITVFCLSGKGTFSAGPDLEEKQFLEAGALITLEPEIEHEVIAEPEIHLLVTKFIGS
jgi:quercetin dioxygenase-like cupin family protein